jgi:hypothetical protein
MKRNNFFYLPTILGGLLLTVSIFLPWYHRTLPDYRSVLENGLGWVLNGVSYPKAETAFLPTELLAYLPFIAIGGLLITLAFSFYRHYILAIVFFVVSFGFLFLAININDWGPARFNILLALGITIVILGVSGLKSDKLALAVMTLYTSLFSIGFLFLTHTQASYDYMPRSDALGNEIIKSSSLHMVGTITAWSGALLILLGSFLVIIAYFATKIGNRKFETSRTESFS